VGFQEDPLTIRLRDLIGVDNIQFGVDYPHDEGTFPHSREVIERTFAGISREDKKNIVGGNAARLYGFPLA
jgi:predicted TIM-barrel fold metal-dependent hydrolase